MRKRLLQLAGQLGLINAGLYLFNRFFAHFSIPVRIIKYYFVVQMIHKERNLPRNRGKNLNSKVITNFNLYNLPCPRPDSVIKDRFDQGAVCLSVHRGDEFAGCFWFIKNNYQEDEVRCKYHLISDDSVWDFDVYVEPKFRLSPVFLKLWDDASEHLLKDGCLYTFSRISAFNPMSLASHKRMGAETVGFAVFLCLGSVQVMMSNLFPFVHVSINSQSFPVFNLKTSP